ncbi:hypothetical protein BUZ69_04425 [Staphylococcus saprophyticus]|uniref:hypothetical protein n=1 Tax=Staphylococcus saprophyticus TaxID=29385 RepID=UPI000D1F35BE|nr:hypothetical protein [Staphylococcus saprophyticus]PTK47086.1 hypothetical protein BUZ69_04425 [Staphylococcus saprophyticus]
MELLELLTATETNNVNKITFNGRDVTALNDFILEYNVSYSTLDEADNDLEEMKENELDNSLYSEGIEEGVEEDYNQIISEFGDVANEEVFMQNFEIENDKINIILS